MDIKTRKKVKDAIQISSVEDVERLSETQFQSLIKEALKDQ